MLATSSPNVDPVPLFAPPDCPRLIIKIGSALLVEPDGRVRRDWLLNVAAAVAERRATGQQVAIVSSGAIALGARRLGLAKGGRASLEDAQAAAATGQIELSRVWAEVLGGQGLTAAQMLVTLDDLEDRRRYLNASATLDRLLSLGVVPVVNENDSVATAEIRFGDNDRLAARVAQAARASGVILLSDVDGLYTADPHCSPDAQLIARIDDIDAVATLAGGGSGSGMGSGGMRAKLEAARIATSAGIALIISSGRADRPLDPERHSMFLPKVGASPRRTWLAGRLTVCGQIMVDAGAAAAIRAGSSLLAAGATHIDGRFGRGDVIAIVHDGRAIARGLSEYDAEDAVKLLGLRTEAQAEVLGHAPRAALVHRDHLALVG